MSFPLIRPEDVEHMPRRQTDRLLARLAVECTAAAERQQRILRDRRVVRDPFWATSARLTELGRCAAEAGCRPHAPVLALARDHRGRFERAA